jgi:transcriptional regulator with XRE-family HTH domain
MHYAARPDCLSAAGGFPAIQSHTFCAVLGRHWPPARRRATNVGSPSARLPSVEGAVPLCSQKRSISMRRSVIIMARRCRKHPTHASGNIQLACMFLLYDLSYMDADDKIAVNLQRIIDERGTNARAVAISAGLGVTAVRDIISRKTRSPTIATLAKITNAIGVSLDAVLQGASFNPKTIAIAGKVGAGAKIPLVDAYAKGDGPQVECPPGLGPHGFVAVEVEGDSMEPVYSAGDLIFYSRHTHENVPSEAIGRRCVVMDVSGYVWLKQLKLGREPDTFDLHSINASVAPMYGARLEWAAPVRLHWPAELVVRVA